MKTPEIDRQTDIRTDRTNCGCPTTSKDVCTANDVPALRKFDHFRGYTSHELLLNSQTTDIVAYVATETVQGDLNKALIYYKNNEEEKSTRN